MKGLMQQMICVWPLNFVFSRQLYKEYRMIDVLQMKDLTFLDTTFSDIDGYVSSRM